MTHRLRAGSPLVESHLHQSSPAGTDCGSRPRQLHPPQRPAPTGSPRGPAGMLQNSRVGAGDDPVF